MYMEAGPNISHFGVLEAVWWLSHWCLIGKSGLLRKNSEDHCIRRQYLPFALSQQQWTRLTAITRLIMQIEFNSMCLRRCIRAPACADALHRKVERPLWMTKLRIKFTFRIYYLTSYDAPRILQIKPRFAVSRTWEGKRRKDVSY